MVDRSVKDARCQPFVFQGAEEFDRAPLAARRKAPVLFQLLAFKASGRTGGEVLVDCKQPALGRAGEDDGFPLPIDFDRPVHGNPGFHRVREDRRVAEDLDVSIK